MLVETRPATSDSSVVTPETFRRVMAQVPTSVTVVAAMTGQGPVGLTVGTFVSASLEPPLIGFLPARSSTTWPLIVPIGEFCVSVLADGHEELGQRFARSGGPKFDGVRWHPAPSGAPIIDGALAWFDCRFERSFSAGDYGRGLLLLTLGAGAVLVAVVVLAEVLLRRRDLGRRRALGASQWGLVGLVVARTVVAAVPGALLGAVGGAVIAAIWAQPPPLEFTCAVTVLTGLVSGIAAIPPAFLAAVRDPVGVLRTP